LDLSVFISIQRIKFAQPPFEPDGSSKWSIKEGLNKHIGFVLFQMARRQTKHIGVIIVPGCTHRLTVVTKGGPDTLEPIGGHTHTLPTTAQQYTSRIPVFAAQHLMYDLLCKHRKVIVRI